MKQILRQPELEQEVGVDPEMLGKVFENLLPENLRKGKGAFYTPREIVSYMTRESLINYLKTKLEGSGINSETLPILYAGMLSANPKILSDKYRSFSPGSVSGKTLTILFGLCTVGFLVVNNVETLPILGSTYRVTSVLLQAVIMTNMINSHFFNLCI